MDSEVSFLALGDWGSATRSQRDVAHQMAKISNKLTLNSSKNVFVAALGDNFYDEGVTDVNDPKWKEIFMDAYNGVQCPWFPVLGNHDWQGNVQAQIDFKGDSRWQMESLYYTKIIQNVQFFFLDTTTLCPDLSEMYTDREFDDKDVDKQLEWFEYQLANSTSQWKIVFGHYPIYSGGENGSALEMRSIETLLYKYKVDAYFCGHDHSFQHIFNRNTQIHYFVCGAGSSTGNLRHIPNYTIAGHLTPGFLHCTVHQKGVSVDNMMNNSKSLSTNTTTILTVKFVNGMGVEMYTYDIVKKLE